MKRKQNQPLNWQHKTYFPAPLPLAVRNNDQMKDMAYELALKTGPEGIYCSTDVNGVDTYALIAEPVAGVCYGVEYLWDRENGPQVVTIFQAIQFNGKRH